MSQQDFLPKTPKIAGINQPFLFAVGTGIALVILLAFFMGGESVSDKIKAKHDTHQQDASREVSALAAKKVKVLLAKPSLHSTAMHQAVEPSLIEGLSKGAFQQAAGSKIEVYGQQLSGSGNTANTPSIPGINIHPVGMGSNITQQDPYTAQNAQSEKKAFVDSEHTASNQLGSAEEKALSPYSLMTGSIISANLLTGINSDLPGKIIAKVSRDIYNTRTGNYLLIPQGTTVTGLYDANVAYGQDRVLIAWSRLIFPNGQSIDLEGMPGVDLVGMAGLHDLVDQHYLRLFGSSLLMSLFGAAGQLSQPQSAGNALTNQQILFSAVGQQMSQTATQLVAKNMNIQPTIKIRPGSTFNILVTKDMVFQGPYQFDQ